MSKYDYEITEITVKRRICASLSSRKSELLITCC